MSKISRNSVNMPPFLFSLVLLGFFFAGCQSSEISVTANSHQGEISSSHTLVPLLTPRETRVSTHTHTPEPSATQKPRQTASHTPTATLAAGAYQISNIGRMVLVYVPAGAFLMGSTESETGADYDEFPQHSVNLDTYWIDQTVVTNAMYVVFLNEMGNQTEGRTTWLDAGDADVLIYQREGIWQPLQGYADHPTVEVTWFGAQAYCQWAGRRLPTEAEWEKAARGPSRGSGDNRIYPWGDEIDCDKAQYANCGGGLLPVNSKPAGASPYGVLGLSGNTWEWVADWYQEDYYAVSLVENPTGPDQGETRTLRGGSWEYDWKHLRAANRRHNGPAVSMHDYGFRCVAELIEP